MVLWCKSCDALLGLRAPLDNWCTDRTGLCAACLANDVDVARLRIENDTAENARLSDESVKAAEGKTA